MSPDTKLTPMLQQYLSIKSGHQDCLLLYRLGDFYELFFEDAIIAADLLGISLTKRGQHLNEDIPMCGVPAHASDAYIEKLVKQGHRVAICEQLETPQEAKKRGYKAVVRREVVRVITAGTLTEDPMLSSKNSNYLGAISLFEGKLSIAWVEITTGEFAFTTTSAASLSTELSRLQLSEIIIPEKLMQDTDLSSLLKEYRSRIVLRADSLFSPVRAETITCEFYNLKSLDGISAIQRHEISAIGALIDYLKHTHKNNLPRLSIPKSVSSSNFMVIDSATRKNLEIDSDQHGNKKFSLRGVLDKTSTAAGGRLLGYYLSSPLTDVSAINRRLESVECLYKNDDARGHIIAMLKQCPDIERAMARIFIQRGSPKDLASIRDGLYIATQLTNVLMNLGTEMSDGLRTQVTQMCEFTDLISVLSSALSDNPSYTLRDGGFIKAGFDIQLDNLRDLKENSDMNLNSIQERYRKVSGVNNLKITKNNIIGYYIEVPVSQAAKMSEDVFIHKQTLGTSARFTTIELREMEAEINTCDQKISSLEISIFEELASSVCSVAEQISLVAQAIAVIDVTATLALIAKERAYVKPIVNNDLDFLIKDGKHPIVMQSIGEKFVENESNLTEDNHTWLITGPNMAGKSTFLRQNALICIMAQIGSFVPASMAKIGVVDKLFSRIGAGDDISRGQSTFMVEMNETAAILNNATKRSLIILDEIGRGTSTFDGLSIAWSVIEYIHLNIGCRTFFATHYHELVELESTLSGFLCHTMDVKEWQDSIIFMHKIVKGRADRSYGVHVAELAGVPKFVTNRAKEVLKVLEAEKDKALGCNSIIPANKTDVLSEEIIEILKNCDIDSLTPRNAFDILYKLKSKV